MDRVSDSLSNDLNGPLYILDKETKKLTTYTRHIYDFNGLAGQLGRFHCEVLDRSLVG